MKSQKLSFAWSGVTHLPCSIWGQDQRMGKTQSDMTLTHCTSWIWLKAHIPISIFCKLHLRVMTENSKFFCRKAFNNRPSSGWTRRRQPPRLWRRRQLRLASPSAVEMALVYHKQPSVSSDGDSRPALTTQGPRTTLSPCHQVHIHLDKCWREIKQKG